MGCASDAPLKLTATVNNGAKVEVLLHYYSFQLLPYLQAPHSAAEQSTSGIETETLAQPLAPCHVHQPHALSCNGAGRAACRLKRQPGASGWYAGTGHGSAPA